MEVLSPKVYLFVTRAEDSSQKFAFALRYKDTYQTYFECIDHAIYYTARH